MAQPCKSYDAVKLDAVLVSDIAVPHVISGVSLVTSYQLPRVLPKYSSFPLPHHSISGVKLAYAW